MPTISFPDDFTFGVATSAYQIEGAWNEDGKGPSIWDTFSHTPGRVWRDIPGDVATDHYHRFREDVAIMRDLGVQSYRMSLSWPRILPEGVGRPNRKGLDFYHRLFDELENAGIAPNVTLYHWDLPQALEDRGGWVNQDISSWFAEYASLAFREFSGRVPRWSTLNEPIAIWVGYGMGLFAPGRTDERAAKQAMHNALVAHGRAVQAFRADGDPHAEIGVVVDIWQRHPASASPADRSLADREEDDSFRFFLNPLLLGEYGERITSRLEELGTMPTVRPGELELIAAPIDYLGLNVYSRVVVDSANHEPRWWSSSVQHPGGNYLDNGMEFYPKSVYDAIFMAKREFGFSGPIYITENGVADSFDDAAEPPIRDEERIRYVEGFLTSIAKAIEDGADVRGYYLWSLMDNYEWAAGFSQRFGLVHVDSRTLKRTRKESASWYGAVIARRGLSSRGE